MANKKFSDLTATTTMADADILALENAGGNSRKITFANLRNATFAPRGCLVGLSTDLTTINASSGYTVPFDAESYDTDAIHDNVTNNTRMTVPSGWAYVRVGFKVYASLVTAQEGFTATIRHFNSSSVEQSKRGLPYYGLANADYTIVAASGLSAPIAVAAGDYFDVRIACNDTSITIQADHTSAWLELLA